MKLLKTLSVAALTMGLFASAFAQQVPEAEKYRISTGYYNQNQPAAPPTYRPPQLPSAYASIVLDWAGGPAYWTTFASSFDEASTASLEACREAGGKDCRALDGFANQCSALAIDGEGYIHQGMSLITDEAEGEAMRRCNAAGRAGICRLKLLSVCSYYGFNGSTGGSEFYNKRAQTATAERLEEQAQEVDRRDYWAAAIETSEGVFWSENQRSQEAAMQKVSEKCGQGRCDPIVTWNKSCAAWAAALNASGKITGRFYTATSAAAQSAHDDALAACKAGSGGNCSVQVACSGRQYVGFEWKEPPAGKAQ